VRFLTAGESHGPGLTIIVDGVPAGLAIDGPTIDADLRRRQLGYGRGGRQKIERDSARITGGVRQGRTTGAPVALWIENRDAVNWERIMSVTPVAEGPDAVTRLRPGHADLAGALKYDHEDVRDVIERASARETAARVAAGGIARALLRAVGVDVLSETIRIGDVTAPPRFDRVAIEASEVRCADPDASTRMVTAISAARDAGDTLGGVTAVRASNVIAGLGTYAQWDRRLDGRIAQSLASIPSAKGVEFADAFDAAGERGSRVHDPIERRGAGHVPVREVGDGAGHGPPVGLAARHGSPRKAGHGGSGVGTRIPVATGNTSFEANAGEWATSLCGLPVAGMVSNAQSGRFPPGAWMTRRTRDPARNACAMGKSGTRARVNRPLGMARVWA
jgi:chorismate synthase